MNMAQVDADIQAQPGVAFQVAIDSTPSTGYLWLLHEQPAAITLLKEETDTAPKAETKQAQDIPIVGRMSTQLFHLVAAAPGDYMLVFELRRPWEPGAVSQHTVRVHVS
jgi:predicted secreted protein